MLVLGVLLVSGGVVAAVVGDWPGSWWLVPTGLIAAGIGVLVAGLVAAVRRRVAPLRSARRAVVSAPGAGGPLARVRAVRCANASWRSAVRRRSVPESSAESCAVSAPERAVSTRSVRASTA